MMKMKIIAALIFFCCSVGVRAQTVTENITLGWTAPTTNTDGSAITGTLTYLVFQGPKAGPFTQVGTAVTGVTTTFTSTPAAGLCFVVQAVEAQGSSNASSVDSTPTAVSCVEEPSAPGNVTITFSVTVH